MDMKVPEGLQPLKMQLSTVLTKLYKVANLPRIAFALKLATLIVSLFITYTIFSDGSSQRVDYKQTLTAVVKGKKNVFIHSVLENEIDGPFENKTIVELCAKTAWIPGLIFKCDAPEGGVGNVRNIFLNCLRYSIEARASGFVVPEMLALTSGTKSSLVPFGHFFDLNHFTTSLSEACPQIHVYSHINDLYDMPSTTPPVPIIPTAFNYTALINKHVLANPGNWSLSFAQYLNHTHPTAPSFAKPVLITVAPPLLEFPLSYDDRHFVPNFGRLLRFREDTRRIAAAVLYALSQKHALSLKFNKEETIIPSKFYGAHLRTGVDATAAGWTTYATQSANYLQEAMHYDLSVIYVVSGNLDDLARLAATNSSIAIETKESLLGASPVIGIPAGPAKGFEREWGEMQALNWDQRLLIDYEVLLRASVFGGTWESSFSWNVAMRRHVVTGGGAWRVITKREEEDLVVRRSEIVDVQVVDVGVRHLVSLETAFMAPYSPPTQNSWRSTLNNLGKGVSRIIGRRPAPEEKQPQIGAPAEKGAVDESEINAEGIKEKEKLNAGETTKGPGRTVRVGERTFSDGLSVVFGPVGVGQRIVSSMWP